MIQINLIPIDQRPKEAASLPYATLVLGGGTLLILGVCGLVAFFFWHVRGKQRDLDKAIREVGETSTELRDLEKRLDIIKKDKERRDIALAIKKVRPTWSDALDLTWSVMDEVGDTWLFDLKLAEERDTRRKKTFGGKSEFPRLTMTLGCTAPEDPSEYERASERRAADYIEQVVTKAKFTKVQSLYRFGVDSWLRNGEVEMEGSEALGGLGAVTLPTHLKFQIGIEYDRPGADAKAAPAAPPADKADAQKK